MLGIFHVPDVLGGTLLNDDDNNSENSMHGRNIAHDSTHGNNYPFIHQKTKEECSKRALCMVCIRNKARQSVAKHAVIFSTGPIFGKCGYFGFFCEIPARDFRPWTKSDVNQFGLRKRCWNKED